MFSSDRTDSLQMSTIFGLMKLEYHETVVKRALDARDTVSKEAQGSLNSAINETAKVPQFPNYPAKSPTPFLIKPVLKATTRSDILAGAVLKVWAESQDALCDVVVKHLENLAMPVEYPDFTENQFRGSWFSDTWMRETDKILERHGEFYKDDVALMLCYVSGKIPGSGKTQDNILSQSLDYLRSLPPIAPEWEQEIPEFVESLNAIRDKKERQRSQAVELDAMIADIGDAFSAELTFFQKDLTSWSVVQLSPDADILEALRLTKELYSLLTEYRAIREIAPVFLEEQSRRPKREALEQRILPMLKRIDRIMAGDQGPDDDTPSGEKREPPQVSDGNGKSEVKNRQAFSEGNFTSLQSENQRLHDQVELLQRQLHKCREESENRRKEAARWRQCYINVASKQTSTVGEDDVSIESVQNAVEHAKKQFGNRLLFPLNAKSRVQDNPFKDPKAVWKALEWMATTLYDSLIGKTNVKDLDLSIREACGWMYKPWQNDLIINTYPNWYKTTLNKKVYLLKRHIGTGNGKDARRTIRIAFEWDETLQRVIVGFIGEHQMTRET